MQTTKMVRLIVDTENYSGNFEREMCAFITGQIGECGVGDRIAFTEKDNIANMDWYNNHIIPVEYEGTYRPCGIYPTEGWLNNGNGVNYKESESDLHEGKYPAYQSVCIYADQVPSKEVFEEFKERAKYFCENYTKTINVYSGFKGTRESLKLTGFRIIEETTVVSTSINLVEKIIV